MTHPRRLTATQHWRALKDGNASADTLAWIADVARKVLEAEKLPANKRRHAIYTASGLTGADEPEAVAIRLILAETFGIEGDSAAAKRARRAKHHELLRWVLAPDLSKGPLKISAKALDGRISTALKNSG
jgi:hypothetical protein